jgi:peptide/nickel transport system substrate-binding protein
MRRSKFWLMVGALCVAMGLSATSALAAPSEVSGAQATAGTVVVGADQEPRTLNTFTNEGNLAWGSYVTIPIMASAVKYNHKGALVMDLFQSIVLEKRAPLTVRYNIKQAAKWSNGRPVTAADVIFTHRVVKAAPGITSRVGHEDVSTAKQINAKSVRLVFSKPYVAYRTLFGRILPNPSVPGSPVSNDLTQFESSMRNSLPLASGPFRFASWNRGSQLVVERNPNYWGKRANLQRIVFRFIPDTNTQFQALRGGEVDIIVPQPQLQIADIKKQRNIRVQQGLQFAWEHVDLQTGPGGHPALRKKFVRQAIFTGINRRQIATALYKEIAPNIPVLNNVIYKPFQPEYVAHKYQPFGFSQAKAISLLRSNGCTGGPARPGAGGTYSCPGVGQLEFDFYSTAGNQLRELAFAIMQKQLASVGIKLNSKFSLTALSVTLPTKKWDIMMFAWVGSPEPAGSVNIHRCGGLQNYYGYCSRPASRLLLRSNEEFDAKKRTALLNEFDRLHAQHAVSLPLFARPAFQIHSTRLQGALLNPTNSGPTWQSEAWSLAR